jgi:septum formation protein
VNLLVLASASAVRASLLHAAGVPFEVRPADIDEETLRASLQAHGAEAGDIAEALAQEKALAVSRASPNKLVLGCDQILAFDRQLLAKPADLGEARAQLQRLRGKQHGLLTACVLAKDGVSVWRAREQATLKMRPFSDDFLDAYLAAQGTEVLGAVGCYHFEGAGAQLFESAKGDYFSILGLALIPLLAALRDYGVLGR